ncbi:Hypothetical predicted protein [Mytilus galloprovincialis]|uniref:Uncharacterized protein n=1 Tax=Mytilus galloprovincialis TaxID=29158 RepID=A0A8B6CCX8_MYTGA|nr:Hypothetical predicted protein [Mytilus galloprovincialis]
MEQYLQTRCITMQRKRIRENMRRTSPFPVAHRLSKTIMRRKYYVAMSNSLWHVDGHIKLIRDIPLDLLQYRYFGEIKIFLQKLLKKSTEHQFQTLVVFISEETKPTSNADT